MDLCKGYWAFGGAMTVAGVAVLAARFDIYSQWFYIGMTLVLLGGTCLNTGYVARRSRTLDEEFAAGYRMGERAGRRVAKPTLVSLDNWRTYGRVQEAPVRSLAGHGQNARWSPTHPD